MSRQRVTVSQVLSRFAFAPLELAHGDLRSARTIRTVLTDDELTELDQQATDVLVLGIGTSRPDDAWKLWQRASELRAVALVVRADVGEALARRRGVPKHTLLLSLGRDASWVRFAAMLTNELERSISSRQVDARQDDAEVDLYEIANAISALIGGPTTIEDMSSRILAFSSDQAHADEPRKSSILGRQVSRAHSDALTDGGIFQSLYSSSEPIFFTPPVDGARPRVAMRIQSGTETLGSIWVIVDKALSPTLKQGLVDAANAVALSLIRTRLADETRSQESVALVTRLLGGGAAAVESAREFGIAGMPAFVLAIARSVEEGRDEHLRSLTRGISSYIRAVSPRSIVARIGPTVYAVIPVARKPDRPARTSQHGELGTDRQAASRFANDLLLQFPKEAVLIGAGDIVDDIAQLPTSRRQADAALGVLASHRETTAAILWRSVQSESLLVELSDIMAARQEAVAAPLSLIVEADEHARSEFLTTVAAYLEHMGDVVAAASSLFVHPNTFRYRLRRVQTITGIDLSDSTTRFALMLQLRLEALLTNNPG